MIWKSTYKITLLFLLALPLTMSAQSKMGRPSKKYYLSTGMEGYILSTTLTQRQNDAIGLSTPRFTGFVNIGVNINYDFSPRMGLYTGLSLKNIGFIEKFNNPDSTVKRRVYTLGVPLGLKLGDVKYGSYLLLGGGVDFPFNYREKGFVRRGDKTKFNEWFSDRTPKVMPYIFVGMHLRPLFSLKLQYYPLNFMNNSYTTSVQGHASQPYEMYDVKLIMLTAGIDIPFRPKS
ncbi:outer membrane beta-barrel protein [Taibaiella koreensis]|uniref:outer membrane beta-barrel protein n=1 Tax=Taibaiella koreensis TaxID=1268548 RepID=UPI0013C352B0|nr:outer membrane beta-barrel protein [Taibaiella koreensis]